MEQLLEFYGNHPILVTAFIGVAAALAWNLISDAASGTALNPVEATNLINHEEAVVLDVRAINEFNNGHILNALNIPANSLADQLKQLDKYRDKPIILCCRSGSRSAAVLSVLRKAGFERVHNLRGGMLAWEGAGLPLKRGK